MLLYNVYRMIENLTFHDKMSMQLVASVFGLECKAFTKLLEKDSNYFKNVLAAKTKLFYTQLNQHNHNVFDFCLFCPLPN